MIWLILIVIVAAAMSLFGSLLSRRDIASGRPKYSSVGDFTGTWDRAKLEELLGKPDEEDRYDVRGKALPRVVWVRVFDTNIADFLCFLGSGFSIWLARNDIVSASVRVACRPSVFHFVSRIG